MSESKLSKFKLHYEDMEPRKTTRISGGKDSKMSKASKAESPAKTYNKSKSEHAKDILIAMLITTIVAFIGGMQFQKNHDAEVRSAMSQSQTAQVTAPEVKK